MELWIFYVIFQANEDINFEFIFTETIIYRYIYIYTKSNKDIDESCCILVRFGESLVFNF